MDIAAKLDDWGKPAWIAVTILAFIIFWPIGLAILAYIIWSGRMGCWKHGGWRRRHHDAAGRSGAGGRWHSRSSSGNTAFDEYREETMRRLEDEQKEFWSFLDKLRHAKDKAEFDQFMADRRGRSDDGPEAPDITGSPNGPAPQPQT